MKRRPAPPCMLCRPAAIGCRSISLLAATAEQEIPKLLPPHGELSPTYWELHGRLMVAAVLAVVAALGLGIGWLRRAKPVSVTPPELVARRALEVLRPRAEDAALVVEVSRILRVYLISALGLPEAEMTTAEFHEEIQARPRIDPETVGAVTEFLRRCDRRKFAPLPPAASPGLVVGALELVERIEAARRGVVPTERA